MSTPPVSQPQACIWCDGTGRVADTPGREPWAAWMSLPLASSAAVLLGWVRPIDCEDCLGSGQATDLVPR